MRVDDVRPTWLDYQRAVREHMPYMIKDDVTGFRIRLRDLATAALFHPSDVAFFRAVQKELRAVVVQLKSFYDARFFKRNLKKSRAVDTRAFYFPVVVERRSDETSRDLIDPRASLGFVHFVAAPIIAFASLIVAAIWRSAAD